jgi:hypothetical protein
MPMQAAAQAYMPKKLKLLKLMFQHQAEQVFQFMPKKKLKHKQALAVQ